MAEERVQWGRQIEFVLTLIGYAVGLGNVWRFPFLCYKNGGGAFLIPYTISLIFLGIPLFALELSFGQFGQKGPLSIWDINPLAKGLGFATIAVSGILMIYYSVVIAWGFRFLIASLTDHLPWIDCKSCDCLLYSLNKTAEEIENFRNNNSFGLNCTGVKLPNESISPSEVYFEKEILWQSGGIDKGGTVQWELMLCNLACFAIVFCVLYKGIQSLGKVRSVFLIFVFAGCPLKAMPDDTKRRASRAKQGAVVYFTSLFPYVLLTILLVRVAMLDGAHEGIKFYLTPRWERLSDATVWSEAAVQIFFSLSCCSGGLIAMASYNNFNNNVIRDSIVVPIVNCLTSFYAGFVVFSTLGYMAHIKQTDVGTVTKGGPGLAFIVYPEAIGQMPVSPLWAICFFIMLCMLGFSSQFSNVETVITAFIDEYPKFLRNKGRILIFRIAVCFGAFVLGIPMVTESGFYLLDLVDGALLGFPMLTVGLMEFMVLVVLYGYENFADDIRCMVGREPFIYFKICWLFISPVLLTALIIFKAFQFKPATPDWANLLYWLVAIFPIALIVLWGAFHICRNSEMTRATSAWFARRETGGKLNATIEVSPDKLDNSLEKGGRSDGLYINTTPYANRKTTHSYSDYSNKAFVNDVDGSEAMKPTIKL